MCVLLLLLFTHSNFWLVTVVNGHNSLTYSSNLYWTILCLMSIMFLFFQFCGVVLKEISSRRDFEFFSRKDLSCNRSARKPFHRFMFNAWFRPAIYDDDTEFLASGTIANDFERTGKPHSTTTKTTTNKIGRKDKRDTLGKYYRTQKLESEGRNLYFTNKLSFFVSHEIKESRDKDTLHHKHNHGRGRDDDERRRGRGCSWWC